MSDCAASALSVFDKWETRDFDGFMERFAADALVRDFPRGDVITDREAVRGWVMSWVTACPDATGGTSVAAANSDTAVLQGVYAGTNTGPLGPLPATGRKVSMPFSIVIRFDGNDRVKEWAVYYDQLSLLTQLGHIPAPA